jgi:hypothetical protein
MRVEMKVTSWDDMMAKRLEIRWDYTKVLEMD